LSLSGCDLIPDAGAKPKVSVTYQETTATVTATWSRPSNVQSSWTIYYEWTNERISGGNACSEAEATTQTTVTFTCSRSEQTVGVMEFTVWAVRNVGGTLYPGVKRSTQYNVEPTGITPPGPVDSLDVQVAWRRIFSGRTGGQTDTATVIQYLLAPATYRNIDYRIGQTESFHYEIWGEQDGVFKRIGYTVDGSWGIVECHKAGNGEVCPVRPFRT
jgi:hypothetical protein